MLTRIIPVAVVSMFACGASAQTVDSVWTMSAEKVSVVTDSHKTETIKNSTLAVEVAEKGFLDRRFSGNLVQTLEYLPGIRSMDIGSGFAKPMIRGMAFNRISVTENGIKHESQQWGTDHGLEIDAFGVGRVVVRKGPASLLYGSDAMGGVIEILQPPAPAADGIFGEAALLGRSVNGTLGGSLMLGAKKKAWLIKLRYSEQHFADTRVPTDSIVYLTQRIPIYGRRLKNTAGLQRGGALFAAYEKGRYSAEYSLSDTYQKAGFFPGAHGIPDVWQVTDDGAGMKNKHVHTHEIEIPANATPGHYHLVVFCTDDSRNETHVAGNITLSHDGEDPGHEHRR